jgi:L-amino acid N-acyltransferase YncA
MTIRPATVEDLPRILKMSEHFAATSVIGTQFGVDPARVAALLERTLASPHEMQAYVAEDRGGRVVGQVAAHVFDHPIVAVRMASMFTWWVEESARGRVGLQLLKHIMAWAADQGAQVVQMSAPRDSNVGSLCAAIGFEASEDSWVWRI